ncbi:MAG: RNA polymerase sigma factor [Tannerellaceae bacterium]
MSNTNDVLWSEIQEGDELAFKSLYDNYADLLYSYGMLIVSDEERVADAIQDLFAYLFEKRKNLSQPNSIKAYLMVSLKRLLLNQSKSKSFYTSFLSLTTLCRQTYDFNLDIDYQAEQEQVDFEEQRVKSLQDGLNSLKPKQREMLYLKYYKGLSTEEIAEVMEVSHSVVYATVKRGIAKLREKSSICLILLFTLLYL